MYFVPQEANYSEIQMSIDMGREFVVNSRAMLAAMQLRPLGELLQARESANACESAKRPSATRGHTFLCSSYI